MKAFVQTEQLNFSVFLCAISSNHCCFYQLSFSFTKKAGLPGFVSMPPYTRVLMDVHAHGHTRVCLGWIYQQGWELRSSQFCPSPNQRCLFPSSSPRCHMNPVGRKGHMGIAIHELHLSLMQFSFSSSPKANKSKDFWKTSLLLLVLFLFLVLVFQ